MRLAIIAYARKSVEIPRDSAAFCTSDHIFQKPSVCGLHATDVAGGAQRKPAYRRAKRTWPAEL